MEEVMNAVITPEVYAEAIAVANAVENTPETPQEAPESTISAEPTEGASEVEVAVQSDTEAPSPIAEGEVNADVSQ